MARIIFLSKEELEAKAQKAWEDHEQKGSLTNMKVALLQDYATYDAYMGWYKSWVRLVEVVGKKAASVLAHSVSTTNNCLLCSLFFVSDLKSQGLDPKALTLDEKEETLAELGRQIVTDPTKVSDELFQKLKNNFSDTEIVVIVGFVGQMIATNNFNSVLKVDVDQRLLPLISA